MVKVLKIFISFSLVVLLAISFAFATTLLDPQEIGFNGQTRDNNYDALLDAYYSNNNILTTIGTNAPTNILWVPWFKTSTSSQVTDLMDGDNCNSGEAIDFTHNCMVTDEFSQVGILLAMGKDYAIAPKYISTNISIN